MKKNLPVTDREVFLDEHDSIITQTDLKGIITQVNHDFIRISGYSAEELIGHNHNIIRHPDMPAAAFEDLWNTLSKGKSWNGLVKNRCKSGDYYWVNAHVTPREQDGHIVGYTSVRTKPSREQIEAASALYASLNAGKANIRQGHAIDTGLWARFGIFRLLDRLSARSQLALLIGAFLLGFVTLGLLSQAVLKEVKVGGPVYAEVAMQKDLVADILPPPEYLIEAWQVTLEMAESRPEELNGLAEKSRVLRQDYETRHTYWAEHIPHGPIRRQIVESAWKPGLAFLELRDREYIPALLAGRREAAIALLPRLKTLYEEHRQQIDTAVKLANDESSRLENASHRIILQGTWLLVGMTALITLLIAVMARAVYRNVLRTGDPVNMGEIIRNISVGNFAFPIHTEKESAESLLHAIQALQSRLRTLIRFVAEEAQLVSTQSGQMVGAAAEVNAGVRAQSESAASVAATTEQLTTSIHCVAENAEEALAISNTSSQACHHGAHVIEEAMQSMSQIAQMVREASETVLTLGAQSESISSVVQVIQDIADQTNLLALNAAIEAARAGEQGRGFAVVADEVRKLAERTSSATKEIEEMIGAIQSGLNAAVHNMESGVREVDEGVRLASLAGDSINNIRSGSERVVQVVSEITQALAEQRIASENIARQVERIAQAAEENSAAAAQTASSASLLEETALQMQNSVSRFVV